jgi:hypothetical protein
MSYHKLGPINCFTCDSNKTAAFLQQKSAIPRLRSNQRSHKVSGRFNSRTHVKGD